VSLTPHAKSHSLDPFWTNLRRSAHVLRIRHLKIRFEVARLKRLRDGSTRALQQLQYSLLNIKINQHEMDPLLAEWAKARNLETVTVDWWNEWAPEEEKGWGFRGRGWIGISGEIWRGGGCRGRFF
jgi:hypothetical protein